MIRFIHGQEVLVEIRKYRTSKTKIRIEAVLKQCSNSPKNPEFPYLKNPETPLIPKLPKQKGPHKEKWRMPC
jgi:hypothetical protein